jgi:hypothetical protein
MGLDPFIYCRRLLHTAWRHSFHAAHSIILALLILAGLLTYFFPQVEIMIDLNGWQVAAAVLGSIIVVRLALAPYWMWKSDQKEIATLKADFLDEERSNIHSKVAKLSPEVKRELYRVVTAEIETDQLTFTVRSELEKAGLIKPAFAYTPAEFIERYRPLIVQWFKQNPL